MSPPTALASGPQAFCKWLSEKEGVVYEGPTEAQWEYACRGGAKDYAVFGIGDGERLTSKLANFDGNYPYGCDEKGRYLQRTTPVGSYKLANGFGLFDMHGNVWVDPTGAAGGSRRVNRGGCWWVDASYCRSAYRDWDGPGDRCVGLGFRLARSVS